MAKKSTWGVGIGFMVILGVLMIFLFHQSQENRKELEFSVEQNMFLVKKNIVEAYTASKDEILTQLKIKILTSNKQNNGIDSYANFANTIANDSDFLYDLKLSSPYKNEPSIYLSKRNLKVQNIDGKDISDWLTHFNLDHEAALKDYFDPDNDKFALDTDTLQFDATVAIDYLFQKDNTSNVFFDQLMMLDSTGVIQYPEEWAGTGINLSDSSSVYKTGSQVLNITLLNKNYQAALTQVQLENKSFYVLGAISEDHLENASYKVNYNLLVILLILVILLVVGIPVFSFLGIRPGDVIKQRTIFSNAISLFFLFVVLGWSSAYFLQGNLISFEEHEEDNAETLRSTIESLSSIKDFSQQKRLSDSIMNLIKINEKITISVSGYINDFEVYDSIKGFGKLDPEGNPAFINIDDRKYFDYFKKNPKSKYFLTRIFSRRNGKPELVISTQDVLDIAVPVKALTFSIKSQEIALDSTRRFFVIKKDGSVIYSSKQIRTPIQSIGDLVSDEKAQEIKILLNRKDAEKQVLDLRLNGNFYKGLILPLEFNELDSDLYLVYFIDFNLGHRFKAIVGLESIAILFLYLLLLVILVGFIYYSFINRTQLNWKKTPFRTLIFNPYMRQAYIKGIWAFGLVIFLQIFLLGVFDTSIYDRLWILTVNLISCLMIVWLIPQKEKERVDLEMKNKKKSEFSGEDDPENHKSASATFAQLILISLGFILDNGGSGNKNKKYKPNNPKTLYTTFIFFFFLSIGFLPAYGVYDTVYNIESKIWKADLIMDEPEEFFTEKSELIRRNFTTTLADLSEGQLIKQVYADEDQLNRASTNMKLGYDFEWGHLTIPLVILLILLLAGMYILTKKLLQTCFDITELDLIKDRRSAKQKGLIEGKRVFLTSLETDNFLIWIKENIPGAEKMELVSFDCNSSLQKSNEADQEVVSEKSDKTVPQQNQKIVLVKNIHCLSKEVDFIKLLSNWEKDFKDDYLILGSGFSIRQFITNRYGISTQTSNEKLVPITELLSNYVFFYVPLEKIYPFKPLNENETNSLGSKPAEEKTDPKEMREKQKFELIKILRHKKAYYMNLWAELSFFEKKFCYYMAKEGLINSKNLTVSTELLQKGILFFNEPKNKYLFFDVTFRYFIIENCPKELVLEFEKDTKANGIMANYTWLLSFFAILVIGIISYFNRGLLGQLEAISTVVVGTVGIIYEGLSRLIPGLNIGKKQP
ncbi:hypothetical protein AAGF08_04040 [Algoriphagus sp. SE2]|uniref:hypothetical protein n=1 Tax=Algoriphagus sp. SE2 TaxID=3141536 RepID=UPI0031CD11D2